MSYDEILGVYTGFDGEATKAMYALLSTMGPMGEIALNVFRAEKNSARAKVYRGGPRGGRSFKGMAYDRKQWSMRNLEKICSEHASACGLTWGWLADPLQEVHNQVLYIDLPTGQVSFHSATRGLGPDYPGKWDGERGQAATRICRWVSTLFEKKDTA